MKIFAISDLHLDGKQRKPMNIFGDQWTDHISKIEKNWKELVDEPDIVLIPGDISWAMKWDDVLEDLELLHSLPGRKICIKGNHDYWWEKIKKLNGLYRDLVFLQNTAYVVNHLGICGTRGWICPNSSRYTSEDEKIYKRECIRLKLSLEDAIKKGAKEIIVMLHYPPTNENREPSAFTQLIKDYPVSLVSYGHLHDAYAWKQCLKGTVEGITYQLVSADYLNFIPILICQ